jgi:hypothetical protein
LVGRSCGVRCCRIPEMATRSPQLPSCHHPSRRHRHRCPRPCTAQGMTAVQAAVGVVTHGLRPEMPRDTPPDVAELVRACWAAVPEQRPSFTQIEVQLAVMLSQARATAAAAAAATARAAPPGLASASGTPRPGPVFGARGGQPSPLDAAAAGAGAASPLPQQPPPAPVGGAVSPVHMPGPLLPMLLPMQQLRPVAAPPPAGAVV